MMSHKKETKISNFINMGSLFDINKYYLAPSCNHQIKNIFVIMNGPGSKDLKWSTINEELSSSESRAIICNGALGTGLLSDSENLIFLANDPIMRLFIEKNITTFNERAEQLLYSMSYPDFTKELIEDDIKSINTLLDYKLTKLATCFPHIDSEKIGLDRQILYKFSLSQKIFMQFGYLWYQDGYEPKPFMKKYGIRTMPTFSRLFKFVKRYKMLSKIWYFLNFNQTPNTFYRALDLAISFRPKNIFFIGRNSQAQDWLLNPIFNSDYTQNVEYKYFFTHNSEKIKIKSNGSLIREIYYSNQYMNMLREFLPGINFISLEKNICYMDFFSDHFSKKYLL